MSTFSSFLYSRQKNITVAQLASLLGASNTDVEISRGSAMKTYAKSLYVNASIKQISNAFSTTDFQLHKILNKKGDTKHLLAHDFLNLLWKPNSEQSSFEFFSTYITNKKLAGEAFIYKVRVDGKITELWNLRPDYVELVLDTKTKKVIGYQFTSDTGIHVIAKDDVVHFKEVNPTNPYRGLSPLAPIVKRIETEDKISSFQLNFFRNSARPDGLLITDNELSEEQREQLLRAWEKRHSNDGAGKLGLLEGGIKYQQVSISQREMDYIQSVKLNRDEILVALGVPKAMINADESNYSTAIASYRMFLNQTILPEVKYFEEMVNEFILVPDYSSNLFLSHRDMTPSDKDTIRADGLAAFGRFLTTNEIRRMNGYPDIEGGDVIDDNGNKMRDESTFSANEDANNGGKKSVVIIGDSIEQKEMRLLAIKHISHRPQLQKAFDMADVITKVTKNTGKIK